MKFRLHPGWLAASIPVLLVLDARVSSFPGPAQAAAPAPRAAGRLHPFAGFVQNVGQASSAARFMARGQRYHLALEADGATLNLHAPGRGASSEANAEVRLNMLGANRQARVQGEERLPTRHHFYLGADPRQWHTNVPSFGQVRYSRLYPGIDLVYHCSVEGRLEYDFEVAPGADPQRIRIGVAGGQCQVDPSGDLVMRTAAGEVRQHRPVVYQVAAGRRREVPGRYTMLASTRGTEVGFKLGAYDRTRPLVIDPTVEYCTYAGGSGNDSANGVVLDGSGNAYVVGDTASTNFPTLNPIPGVTGGSTDVWASRYDSLGNAAYVVTLGGSDQEFGNRIAVDAGGNAYLVGASSSDNFPTTPGAFQNAASGSHAFVAKLDPSGSLLASTEVRGDGTESGKAICLDDIGNVCITGFTSSTNFPTSPGAFQAQKAGGASVQNAFVTKLNSSLTQLVMGAYLGGAGNSQQGSGVASFQNDLFVVGTTGATDFPRVAAAQNAYGGGESDAFVSVVSADGTVLRYSTFLGGREKEIGTAIAMDTDGGFAVCGVTTSINFPTLQPFQSVLRGGQDAFLTRWNAARAVASSTYFGGNGPDIGSAVAAAGSGAYWLFGTTAASDLFSANPLQVKFGGGGSDGFYTLLPASGSPTQSSFFGGTGAEFCNAGAALGTRVLLVGQTSSRNLPVKNARQATLAGGTDAFIVDVSAPAPCPTPNAPTRLVATTVNGKAHLTWRAGTRPPTITQFVIQRQLDGTGSFDLAGPAVNATNASSYQADVDLPPSGSRYTFQVVARNNCGESAASNTQQIANVPVPVVVLSIKVTKKIKGGRTVNGTVGIRTAPTQDIDIPLQLQAVTGGKGTPPITVPATVRILRGKKSGTFTVQTTAVTASQSFIITASKDGSSKSVTVMVTR